MGFWAERFAKGRENYARASRARGIARSLTIGFILAGAGGHAMYSDLQHYRSGKPSTATLIEHLQDCTIEYQRIGEERRKDPMNCTLAEELQRRVGANKIKISRDSYALVRFPLADGKEHTTKVEESKLGSHKLPVGATIAVVYDPVLPADVRAVLSWERLKIPLILLAAGLFFLTLMFFNPITALYRWIFHRRTPAENGESVLFPASYQGVAETRSAVRMTSSAPRASFGMRK
jgi:hypothetical protein